MPAANPVLVYQLRRLVRNRVIVALMTLYLAAMSLFLFVALSSQATGFGGVFRGWFHFHYTSNFETATAIFLLLFYYVFTTVALVGFAATGTAGDRLREHPVAFTTISAWQTISGKLQFGFVVSGLFLTMTLPFLSVAFLMRGVDLRILFWTGLIYFCLMQLQHFVTVMFYSGASTVPRIVMFTFPWGLCQFLLSIFGLFATPSIAYEFIRRGDYGLVILLIALFLAFMLTAIVLTLVQLLPATSNRMMPVRVLLFVAHLGFLATLWGGVVYCGVMMKPMRRFLDVIDEVHIAFCFLFPYLFLIFICERDSLTPRVRPTVPRSFRGRLLAFPFYTGVAHAMVFALLLLSLEAAYVVSIWGINTSRHYCFWGNMNAISAGLLFFDYCATVLALHYLYLHRYFERQWNWVPLLSVFGGIFLLFLAAATLLPYNHFLRTFVNNIDFARLWFLPNPLWITDEPFIGKQLKLAVTWLLLLGIPAIPWWLVPRFRAFTRNESEQVSE